MLGEKLGQIWKVIWMQGLWLILTRGLRLTMQKAYNIGDRKILQNAYIQDQDVKGLRK